MKFQSLCYLLLETTAAEREKAKSIEREYNDFGAFKDKRTIIATGLTDVNPQSEIYESDLKSKIDNALNELNSDLKTHYALDLNEFNSVIDDKKRKVRLSKILEKNPKYKDLQSEISKYGSQHSSKFKSDLYAVVITHDPIDIAGMSTDRHWTSCMNIRTGAYKDQPFEQIMYGGMVAYLLRQKSKSFTVNDADDILDNDKAEDIIARIDIKRYVGRTNDNFLFENEKKCYTAGGISDDMSTKFQQLVEKALDKSNETTMKLTDTNDNYLHNLSYSDTLSRSISPFVAKNLENSFDLLLKMKPHEIDEALEYAHLKKYRIPSIDFIIKLASNNKKENPERYLKTWITINKETLTTDDIKRLSEVQLIYITDNGAYNQDLVLFALTRMIKLDVSFIQDHIKRLQKILLPDNFHAYFLLMIDNLNAVGIALDDTFIKEYKILTDDISLFLENPIYVKKYKAEILKRKDDLLKKLYSEYNAVYKWIPEAFDLFKPYIDWKRVSGSVQFNRKTLDHVKDWIPIEILIKQNQLNDSERLAFLKDSTTRKLFIANGYNLSLAQLNKVSASLDAEDWHLALKRIGDNISYDTIVKNESNIIKEDLIIYCTKNPNYEKFLQQYSDSINYRKLSNTLRSPQYLSNIIEVANIFFEYVSPSALNWVDILELNASNEDVEAIYEEHIAPQLDVDDLTKIISYAGGTAIGIIYNDWEERFMSSGMTSRPDASDVDTIIEIADNLSGKQRKDLLSTIEDMLDYVYEKHIDHDNIDDLEDFKSNYRRYLGYSISNEIDKRIEELENEEG